MINLNYEHSGCDDSGGVRARMNRHDAIVHGHPTYIAATTGTPTGKVYVVSSDSTRPVDYPDGYEYHVQTHLTLQGSGRVGAGQLSLKFFAGLE